MASSVRDTSKALVIAPTDTFSFPFATLSYCILAAVLISIIVCLLRSSIESTEQEPEDDSSPQATSPPRLRTSTVTLPSGAVVSVRQITPRKTFATQDGS